MSLGHRNPSRNRSTHIVGASCWVVIHRVAGAFGWTTKRSQTCAMAHRDHGCLVFSSHPSDEYSSFRPCSMLSCQTALHSFFDLLEIAHPFPPALAESPALIVYHVWHRPAHEHPTQATQSGETLILSIWVGLVSDDLHRVSASSWRATCWRSHPDFDLEQQTCSPGPYSWTRNSPYPYVSELLWTVE